MKTPSEMTSKIQKIMTKAASTTSPDEAEVFMAKAQQLMMEHGLTLLDLGRLDVEDPVGHDLNVTTVNSSANWRLTVAQALSKYYGAEVIVDRSTSVNSIHLFGRESARITFICMIEYIYRQVRAQAHIAHKAGHYTNHKRAMTDIGAALTLRIYRLTDLAAKSAPAGRGLNALVPVDLIAEEIKATFSVKYTKGARIKTSQNAMDYAKNIGLNHQTTAAQPSRQITK